MRGRADAVVDGPFIEMYKKQRLKVEKVVFQTHSLRHSIDAKS
jgi:hypothetical protein